MFPGLIGLNQQQPQAGSVLVASTARWYCGGWGLYFNRPTLTPGGAMVLAASIVRCMGRYSSLFLMRCAATADTTATE